MGKDIHTLWKDPHSLALGISQLKLTIGSSSNILKVTSQKGSISNQVPIRFFMMSDSVAGILEEMELNEDIEINLTGATFGYGADGTYKLYIHAINEGGTLYLGVSNSPEAPADFDSTPANVTTNKMLVNSSSLSSIGSTKLLGWINATFTASGASWVVSTTVGDSSIEYQTDNSFNEDNYVRELTSNNTFNSTSSNNPYGLGFDDLLPKFGRERVLVGGLVSIADYHKDRKEQPVEPFDSSNKPGFYALDMLTGEVDKRIRYYGEWLPSYDSINICSISSNNSGDYIVVTGIFNELCTLGLQHPDTTRGFDIYVNGGSDSGNHKKVASSNVITGKFCQENQLVYIESSDLTGTKALRTVKLTKDGSGYSYVHGFEFINNSVSTNQDLTIPYGEKIIEGKLVKYGARVGSDAVNYKGILNASLGSEQYSGTKGGRLIGTFDKDGNLITKVQEVEEQIQNGYTDYDLTGDGNDGIYGLTDSSKYYANSQGNLIRITDTTRGEVYKNLQLPTAAPDSTKLKLANLYNGSASATALTTPSQYLDNGSTAATFNDDEAVKVELYGKILANADFSNSEVYRTAHWREFGGGNTDDFNLLDNTPATKAGTLDDNMTSLTCANCAEDGGGSLYLSGTGYIQLTFVGTGLSIKNAIRGLSGAIGVGLYLDGVRIATSYDRTDNKVVEIASDLPYGVHVLRAIWAGAGNATINWLNFNIYQPKTKKVENKTPDFAYNLLADFKATSLPTKTLSAYTGEVDQGVLRMSPTRETSYYTDGSLDRQIAFEYLSGIAVRQLTGGNTFQGISYVWGKDKIRFWHRNSSTGTFDVLIDGSVVLNEINNTATFGSGELADLGSLDLHRVEFQKGSNTTANHYYYGFDYHTTIHEPGEFKLNNFDRYLHNGSIGRYSQVGKDVKFIPRQIRKIGSSLSGMAHNVEYLVPAAGIYLPAGIWDLAFMCQINLSLTGASGVTQAGTYLYRDGILYASTFGGMLQYQDIALWNRRDNFTITVVSKGSYFNFKALVYSTVNFNNGSVDGAFTRLTATQVIK